MTNQFDSACAYFSVSPKRDQHSVKCVCHDDTTASLSIARGTQTDLIVHCHAGCQSADILRALQLPPAPRASVERDAANAPRRIVAEYRYEDASGALVAVKRRYEPKSFDWLSPDAPEGARLRAGVPGGQRVVPLYRLRAALDAVARGDSIYVVEGEKDADALALLGLAAVTNPEGAGGASGAYAVERWQPLSGADVVILPDNDNVGKAHAQRVASVLAPLAASVRVVTLPALAEKGDVSDFLNAGGTIDELRAVVIATPLWGTKASGPDGAAILDSIADAIRRFVVLSEEAVVATSLWVLHTHAFEAAEFTPYLAISSPTRASGKTTFLDVVEAVCRNPLKADSATAAALYRSVDAGRGRGETDTAPPTLLLDEMDATFNAQTARSERAEAVRGVLNSGFRRGGKTLVCDGDKNEPRAFVTFCPKVMAGIGRHLPDTVADRSIPIELARATVTERARLQPARRRELAKLELLRDRAADWARVAVPRLLDTDDPELDGLSARQVDIWGPLFAIADYCGGDWPTKARSSALALHRERGDSTDGRDAGVALLADLRELFDSEGAEFIRSSRLAELLRMQEDRPWPEFTRGGTISTSAIARLLKPYGIVPRQERIGGEKCRAYWFADCREPFKRYLPPREAGTVGTPGTVGAFVQTVPTAPAIRQGVPQFDDVVLNDKGYPADWDTPAIAAA